MQQKDTHNQPDLSDISRVPHHGRILAIDPGTKRIGAALSDERRIAVRRLPIVERSSWKKLLAKIRDTLSEFDAVALVVGLPYNFDGSESDMSREARELARKFALSLEVPVLLQDERASTFEARGRLWQQGYDNDEIGGILDSEAAAVILADFMDRLRAARA